MWGVCMLTNTDATLYHRVYDSDSRTDIWNRIYIPEVWWHQESKSNVTSEGLQVADAYTIRIPDVSIEIKKDDYLIKRNCEKEIKTVKDFPDCEKCRVVGVNYNRIGNEPHVKVVGV